MTGHAKVFWGWIIGMALCLAPVSSFAALWYSETSTKAFSSGGGQKTEHVFIVPSGAVIDGNGGLVVGVRGDFDLSTEYAEVSIEGVNYGQVNGGSQCSSSYSYAAGTISKGYLENYVKDGQVVVTVQNSSSVNFSCSYMDHEVTIGFYYTIASVITAPEAPQNLKATASSGEVKLTWSAPGSDGGASITEYWISRGQTVGSLSLIDKVSGNALTYTDSTVSPGNDYVYGVSAVNSTGAGPEATASVTIPFAFTATPDTVAVSAGKSATITLSGGSGIYQKVTSSDTSVAQATLSGNKVTVTGMSKGTAILTVTDSAYDTVTVDVTVTVSSVLKASPDTVDVSVGKSATILIGGGSGVYLSVVSSDDSVAQAILNGNKVTVTGVSAGTATLTVTDSAYYKVTVDVTVTMSSVLKASPDKVDVPVGKSATILIGGGSGVYSTVVSSDASVAQATLSGNKVTVKGVSEGTATLTVTDSAYDTVTVDVTVTSLVVNLISPQDNGIILFTGGVLDFTFAAVSSAKGYVLNLNLYDMIAQNSVPLEVLLASGTPGFSVSGLGIATYSVSVDAATWDALAMYAISWNISGLSDAQDTSSVMGTSGTWNFKLQPSGSVTLLTPGEGTILSRATDSPPTFKWDLYSGASGYDLILAHVGAVGFDKYLDYPGQTLNMFPLDNTAWQTMDNGTWYWTVLAQDATGMVISPNFTIWSFKVTD